MPFICFLGGYYTLDRIMRVGETTTPAIIGLSLQQGLATLSAEQLCGHILHEVETADVTAGTIIEQMPSAEQLIKRNQSVGLVIARQPDIIPAPHLYGLSRIEASEKALALGLKLKEHFLEHTAPRDSCVSHNPGPGEPVENKTLHAYFSTGRTPFRIMPDLVGKSYHQVAEALKGVALLTVLNHDTSDLAHDTIITKQKPLAGTIIDLTKPLHVYVIAREEHIAKEKLA